MTRGAVQCLLGLAAVLIAGLGGLGVLPSAAAPVPSEPFRAVPPALQAAGHQLGLPDATLLRLQVRWGLPRGLREPHPGYITGAYQDGHVYLRRTAHPLDALAYEYLHDVWAQLAPAQRLRVTALLSAFDDERHGTLEPSFSKLIRADIRNGAVGSAARLDELHSIACSRTRDEHLSHDLRDYCTYVLPGRQITTKKY